MQCWSDHDKHAACYMYIFAQTTLCAYPTFNTNPSSLHELSQVSDQVKARYPWEAMCAFWNGATNSLRLKQTTHLKPAVVFAELLQEVGVKWVERLLLTATVHNNVNNLSLLFVFQPQLHQLFKRIHKILRKQTDFRV